MESPTTTAIVVGCMDSVDWNGGMEWWNGMEWNGMTRGMQCSTIVGVPDL